MKLQARRYGIYGLTWTRDDLVPSFDDVRQTIDVVTDQKLEPELKVNLNDCTRGITHEQQQATLQSVSLVVVDWQ